MGHSPDAGLPLPPHDGYTDTSNGGESGGKDPATGDGFTITLWESEETMKASEEAAGAMRSAAVASLGGELVDVRRFEVATIEL